jgi:DNA-binding NarL/FixJ family response regulator
MDPNVKLVILEDCHLYCDGLRDWLGEDPSIKICDQVEDWKTYQLLAADLMEFITVTSMHWIKNGPGIEEFSSFHKNHPSISVYCINLKDDDLRSMRLFDSEIKGFVTRRATKKEFIFGLNEVIKGRFYISTEQRPGEQDLLNGTKINLSIPLVELTKREIEILNLISLGFSDKEIGNKLNISKRTVDGYRHNLLIKFGARNSPNLVNFAIAGNYISGEDSPPEKKQEPLKS